VEPPSGKPEPKLFLGKFSCTINTKNRFSAPSAFREELGDRAYLTQGFDRNLQVLTEGAFQEISRQIMSLNIADPMARMLLRIILGTAHELQKDGQSNLAIPEELKAFAGLHKDVILVGQGDYFEIWSPDLWAKQEAELSNAEVNAGRFSALTIATR
jgi:MraZ protein